MTEFLGEGDIRVALSIALALPQDADLVTLRVAAIIPRNEGYEEPRLAFLWRELEPSKTAWWWLIHVPSIPNCFTQGESAEEAMWMARDCATLLIECLLENGQEVPPADWMGLMTIAREETSP